MRRWSLDQVVNAAMLASLLLLAPQTSSAQDPPILKVSATLTKPLFQPDARYDDTLVVIVEDADGNRVEAEVVAEVGAGPVALYTSDSTEEAATKTATSTGGAASFGVATEESVGEIQNDFFVIVRATASEGGATGQTVVQGDVGSGFEQSFRSERVSSEVFTGVTMARAYDEEGASTGFDETSMVVRFRVDTLWLTEKPQALHTGLELQFGTFPTTTASTNVNDPRVTEFADAYTGSILAIYQPGGRLWSSYTSTSQNRDPDLRYDAFRHGFIGRVGVTSREGKSGSNNDTDVLHYRVGYLFTHHQTRASHPEADSVNVFPMRFVEISVGRYEEIFEQEDDTRLIVEAGLRLPGLGNDAIPFYGGLFLNAGEGQDDFRVFGGFLFKLDRIVSAFR
jgi:hypothetical protein